MTITDDELRRDIEDFYVRLQKAKDKFVALPETAKTLQGRKKLFKKKQNLLSEIKHVRKLIEIGNESLCLTGNVSTFRGGYL